MKIFPSEKPMIAVDLCNTLADINGILERDLGVKPNPFQYLHPGATKQYFKENLGVFRGSIPIKGAVLGMNILAEEYSIFYLTSRPQEAREVTIAWLKRWGFPQAPVILSSDKEKSIRQMGVRLAIEDAPDEIIKLEKHIPVLVVAQPYNLGMGTLRFYWETFNRKTISKMVG